MQQVLTSKELNMHLNNFRQTLLDFDYSTIDNIRFLNLESVYAYMENIDNNPFKVQYNKIKKSLDIIEPYLPFLSSERAKDFLIDVAKVENDNEIEELKKEYIAKLRIDFIKMTNKITNDDDWETLVSVCEKIRFRREESYLH